MHQIPVARTSVTAHVTQSKNLNTVLLTTARVLVNDRYGNQHPIRILIDQGSETSLITKRLTAQLRLPRKHSSMIVLGIGGIKLGMAKGTTTLVVSDSQGRSRLTVTALVVPEITHYPSRRTISQASWSHIKKLDLADPNYTNNDPVDVLLGADAYHRIIESGLRKGGKSEPVAQKTAFGWILSGIAGRQDVAAVNIHTTLVQDSLSTLVRQFWEQEEVPKLPIPLSEDERQCEQTFVNQHTRDTQGRYMVRLPISEELPDLMTSRRGAITALTRTERKFKTSLEFERLYKDFMETYEMLGHMRKVSKGETASQNICYLPHHGVWKESSSTTKLRVVFNGSWRLPSGISLNDYLSAGTNLLPALTDMLLRWRKHRFVVAADMEKVYGQIMVHPADRDLQRILWRSDAGADIDEYQLNTVTYGLACAPFLALRTLKQLALDEQSKYPVGSAALLRDVYVDDVLTGADEIEQLQIKARELNQLCMAGGFSLRKWASNSTAALKDIPPCDHADSGERDWNPTDNLHATLGLQWSPRDDVFSYTVKLTKPQPLTKRVLLPEAAQLFDPPGWLTPVTIRAKISIQATWLLNLQWDDPLPEQTAKDWTDFHSRWPALTALKIERAMGGSEPSAKKEIHGFADASEKAYAAVVYLRSQSCSGTIATSLLAAKCRVAPLKQISLPRLELCGAQLLVNLTKHIIETLEFDKITTHLWSDSNVALGWIQGHPSRWKTYVANRVSEIQRFLPDAQWHHIAGANNPADCATRGLTPSELAQHNLWWNGPNLLHSDTPSTRPQSKAVKLEDLPEARPRVLNVNMTVIESPILERFSDYNRLLKVTAWCRRWLMIAKQPADQRSKGPLSRDELSEAENMWVRLRQTTHFSTELRIIHGGSELRTIGPLNRLTPFLDPLGILRVGGRLNHSSLSYDEKHPIILPPEARFTSLLIHATHRQMLHGGTQLTLASLRQRFWVPRARRLVKGCIHRCTRCVRWRAAPAQQLMSDLPSSRANPSRAFQYTGVDYAGPIHLKTAPGRGRKSMEGFIVIFVCLSSRAVHLDAASDYSSEAFLAVFRRFISRRGLCSEMWSDQGTNFVGADKALRQLFAASSCEGKQIAEMVVNERVKWRFNPPAAPHFGGIWEAAVKSIKYHLRRVIGETLLTFEAMTTMLAQIEACLNSRPLSAMTDDSEDLSALTPGHLLIGFSITALPEPSLLTSSHLSRWQHITKMRDDFWARWSQEYLQGLNQRNKWHKPTEDYNIGRLCNLRSDVAPPSRWALCRIKAAYPGADGLIRTVKVRTATTELIRPITKLVLHPTANNINEA